MEMEILNGDHYGDVCHGRLGLFHAHVWMTCWKWPEYWKMKPEEVGCCSPGIAGYHMRPEDHNLRHLKREGLKS